MPISFYLYQNDEENVYKNTKVSEGCVNKLILLYIPVLQCIILVWIGLNNRWASGTVSVLQFSSLFRLCVEEGLLFVDWNDFPNWIQFLIEM